MTRREPAPPAPPATRQINADAVPPQAWRNGGGRTRELLCWPTAGGGQAPDDTWRLRISLADIDRSGPFSAFPGVGRWFAVVSGAGVVLTLAGKDLPLTPGSAPLHFDGAAAPGCRLVDGPTRDLNLMLRGASGHMARAATGVAWQPGAVLCGLFTTTAGCCVADGHAHHLPAHTLLWFDAAPAELVFTPQGTSTPPETSPDSGAPIGWWLAATPWPEPHLPPTAHTP